MTENVTDCVKDALASPSTFKAWVEKKKGEGEETIGTAYNRHYCPLWQFIHDTCPGVSDVSVSRAGVSYKLPDIRGGHKFVDRDWTRDFIRKVDVAYGRVPISRIENALHEIHESIGTTTEEELR